MCSEPELSLTGSIMLINCVRLPQMGRYKGQSMKTKSLYIGAKELGVSVRCGNIWLNTDGVLSQ